MSKKIFEKFEFDEFKTEEEFIQYLNKFEKQLKKMKLKEIKNKYKDYFGYDKVIKKYVIDEFRNKRELINTIVDYEFYKRIRL